MKIKTYFGPTLYDALNQAKSEFGDDVVLMESQKIQNHNYFKKEKDLIQITVAVDTNNNKVNRPVDNGNLGHSGNVTWEKSITSQKSQSNTDFGRETKMSNELISLRYELNKLNRRLRKMTPPDFPDHFSEIYERLVKAGISNDDAISYVRHAYIRLDGESEITHEKILESVKAEVLSLFKQDKFPEIINEKKLKSETKKGKVIESVKTKVLSTLEKGISPGKKSKEKQKVVVLIGPTGVGKTTTIMKLAAHPDVYGRKNVAIATTDIYRIAATEPLKAFSKIVSIPVIEIKDPQNANLANEELKDMDVILVDMAGRGPIFPNYIQELQSYLLSIKPTDTLLVLSATADLEDLNYSAGLYLSLNPTGIIFTKVDETFRPGKIVSMIQEIGLPVAYISNGQSIPNDIVVGNGEFIWERILESE